MRDFTFTSDDLMLGNMTSFQEKVVTLGLFPQVPRKAAPGQAHLSKLEGMPPHLCIPNSLMVIAKSDCM